MQSRSEDHIDCFDSDLNTRAETRYFVHVNDASATLRILVSFHWQFLDFITRLCNILTRHHCVQNLPVRSRTLLEKVVAQTFAAFYVSF